MSEFVDAVKTALEKGGAANFADREPIRDAARRYVRMAEPDYIASRDWLKHKHGVDLSLSDAKAIVDAALADYLTEEDR